MIWAISPGPAGSVETKNYYDLLGVTRNGDDEEIKKAFRRLAHRQYPERLNKQNNCRRKTKEINKANIVFSDPDQRRKYDQMDANWNHPEWHAILTKVAKPRFIRRSIRRIGE